MSESYRGRLAPSPTGYLHLGHARTFWIAQQRAEAQGGALVLRSEDLDQSRCRPEFVTGMLEDLRWLGLRWVEGPDIGGPHAPYNQSDRMPQYVAAFEKLRERGLIYPCRCSRQDVLRAIAAPHLGEDEPIYPGTCRPTAEDGAVSPLPRAGLAWRFRVPSGETVAFTDGNFGRKREIAGADFGDFAIWRKDDLPAYQLACVVDDAAMRISEVVRGADLITSTFRQLLLYWALGLDAPAFYHCALVLDEQGRRMSKRDQSTTLRGMREQGVSAEKLRARFVP